MNGTYSNWAEVTSGIPQGSVLGPILFVLYINDITEIVSNNIYLFADDTKIYSQITTTNTPETLQNDLNLLEKWSKTWLLLFHPDKCRVMRLGNRPDQPYDYKLEDTSLEYTDTEKDLGITFDNKLKFNSHINIITKKANSVMGIVRKCFRYLDEDIFKRVYKGIVRPHLEYGVPIWNPHYKKDIRQLEGVQRRATKQINTLKNMSYQERLNKLGLPTLLYRRLRGDMIEVYKVLNGKYDNDVSSLLARRITQVDQVATCGLS